MHDYLLITASKNHAQNLDEVESLLYKFTKSVKKTDAGVVAETNSSDELKELKRRISESLALFIVNKYEKNSIKKIINTCYGYFSPEEKQEIYGAALEAADRASGGGASDKRLWLVKKQLDDYWETADEIVLDGFVNFRLGEYNKELENIVDEAVENFVAKREYREFIKLLQYFVNMQESKCSKIHVVPYKEKYIILDEQKKDITGECINDFISELTPPQINYDDLLISSLVTLAPKSVILHNSEQIKNRELIETIKNVFENRAEVCPGCDICMTAKNGIL